MLLFIFRYEPAKMEWYALRLHPPPPKIALILFLSVGYRGTCASGSNPEGSAKIEVIPPAEVSLIREAHSIVPVG